MRSSNRVIHLLVLGIAFLTPSISMAEGLSESVESVIESRIADKKLVGIVIGIVDKDGTAYYSYGEKEADGGEAPDENTVFEIGSISKVFTGILLADAVVRGEMNYADSINTYLPSDVKTPENNGQSITLEQLSVQNSGLPRMPNNFRPKSALNPFADYSYEQLYECLGSVELDHDIGETYAYSNLGVGLLGHLLERATDKTYEALVIERIAKPLGMPDTCITLNDDLDERLAPGHMRRRQVPNWDIPTLAGAGALRATAKDMTVFLAANFGLVASPLLAAMEESHRPRADAGGPQMKIGLGWHIRVADGPGPIVWHNGGTGGYRTFAGFVKESGKGVVVLTNSGGQGHDDIGFHLLNDSLPLRMPPKERAEVEVNRGILERYVGKYELAPDFVIDVDLKGNQLRTQATGQSRVPIFAESDTKFFLKVTDAQLTFEVDDEGNVTGLILHQGGANQHAKRVE